jgi:Putative protein-S-isoprenylcysteine methyltransferase
MKNLLLNLVVVIMFQGVLPAVLIFILAGRWDLWNVWAYVGTSVVSPSVQTLIIYRKSADLLKDCMKPPASERVRLTAESAFIGLSIVRHPGYIGVTLASFGSGMALNSLLSIIPAVTYLVVTVGQTMFEDQMLRDELAGYADYAAKVRYRLIPAVW